MNSKWSGLVGVALVAVAIIALKQQGRGETPGSPQTAEITNSGPSVLLVADLREAEDRCICGEIIRAVRAAHKQGVPVRELTPESQSDLLKRYRVLTFPTVLILDQNGREVSRYEGENQKTFTALKSRLEQVVKAAKSGA